jgi:Flp pilus assembly protein TadG
MRTVTCRTRTSRFGDERGSTIVLIAVSLFAVLALGALSVDLASLRSAHAEAQRAADVIALAGASAFKDKSYTDPTALTDAQTRAIAVARSNMVRSDTLDVRSPTVDSATYGWGKVTVVQTAQVTLNIIPDSQRVRAWVRHAGVGTFFGGMLAKPYGHVQAMATAQASQSGTINCLKPFALPDVWNERNTSSGKTGQDKNANRVWDDGEPWQFEPTANPADTYVPYDPDASSSAQASQTGYGSAWRNADGVANDWGRTVMIKAQRPGDAITSGWFYPWRIGSSSGGNDYRGNISSCNPAVTSLGQSYDVENGNMVGPTKQGIDDLIAQDPGAQWNSSLDGGKGGIEGSQFGNWRNSPRVIAVALFDPNQIAGIQSGGNLSVTFNNFALFFVEGFVGNGTQAPLKGRFLYFATGNGTGPVHGPLTRTLQLIQ